MDAPPGEELGGRVGDGRDSIVDPRARDTGGGAARHERNGGTGLPLTRRMIGVTTGAQQTGQSEPGGLRAGRHTMVNGHRPRLPKGRLAAATTHACSPVRIGGMAEHSNA